MLFEQVEEIELRLMRIDEVRLRIAIEIANRNRTPMWGCSSVGRAVALQAIGQEFESPQLHQLWLGYAVGV